MSKRGVCCRLSTREANAGALARVRSAPAPHGTGLVWVAGGVDRQAQVVPRGGGDAPASSITSTPGGSRASRSVRSAASVRFVKEVAGRPNAVSSAARNRGMAGFTATRARCIGTRRGSRRRAWWSAIVLPWPGSPYTHRMPWAATVWTRASVTAPSWRVDTGCAPGVYRRTPSPGVPVARSDRPHGRLRRSRPAMRVGPARPPSPAARAPPTHGRDHPRRHAEPVGRSPARDRREALGAPRDTASSTTPPGPLEHRRSRRPAVPCHTSSGGTPSRSRPDPTGMTRARRPA
ncbi:hypothetical protein EHYA_07350 [Embleya hyalina]|uniref:Uncharacterized protein n=1 Tax=Embleya hyalina TaxID=516124 RepID=A0A401YYG3_9ACTN|nr:hypothetical protein EHYA_07350 [Embleya hyalina]